MNIAITFRDDMPLTQLVHSNGIAQNIKFLYDLLELIECKPFFLTFGDASVHDSVLMGKQYRSMTFRSLIDEGIETPVVLEIAVTLNPDHREALRHTCKSKIVSIRYGNSMIMDIQETVLTDRVQGTLHVTGADALWISPHFSRSKSYLETIYQCEALYCPYIWEPDFVSPEFTEGKVEGRPDIYVMEPNIDVMKTAQIPICIISELYQRHYDRFGKAVILNSEHFSGKSFFLQNIVANLPGLSNESDKVFFTGRYTFDEVFKSDDILLGHQWECALNYLYFEALYKGVRLVHNSEFMQEVGFYYPDCEVQRGVDACKRAIEMEVDDSTRNRHFLANYSIYNKKVQDKYRLLLEQVTGKTSLGLSA